jgi:hypothetical protein
MMSIRARHLPGAGVPFGLLLGGLLVANGEGTDVSSLALAASPVARAVNPRVRARAHPDLLHRLPTSTRW